MAYGIKVSQNGEDVKTCSDDKKIVDSELWNPKIKAHGEFSATLPANNYSADIVIATHSLGYKPMFLVYCEIAEYGGVHCDVVAGQRQCFSATYGCVTFVSWATTTQLKIRLVCMTQGMIEAYSRTFDGHYYIFHDPAT